MTEPVEVLTHPALAGAAHGFLGRRGGVSTGLHAGLNVGWGSEDDPDATAENRARAVGAVLPGARLVCAYQVHSADVVTVTEPWDEADRPHADALVTDRVYRPAFSEDETLAFLRAHTGRHFEPRLFECFMDNYQEIYGIRFALLPEETLVETG